MVLRNSSTGAFDVYIARVTSRRPHPSGRLVWNFTWLVSRLCDLGISEIHAHSHEAPGALESSSSPVRTKLLNRLRACRGPEGR
jgi:hypothetical protein